VSNEQHPGSSFSLKSLFGLGSSTFISQVDFQ